MRWIVFDDETAEFVTGKYKRGAAEVRYDESPLDAVLKARGHSVLMLPSTEPGKVLFASIECKTAESAAAVVAQFTPLRNTLGQRPPSPQNPTHSPSPFDGIGGAPQIRSRAQQ